MLLLPMSRLVTLQLECCNYDTNVTVTEIGQSPLQTRQKAYLQRFSNSLHTREIVANANAINVQIGHFAEGILQQRKHMQTRVI